MNRSVAALTVAAACCILTSLAEAQGNPGGIIRVDSPAGASSGVAIVAGSDRTEARQAGKFSGISLDAPVQVSVSIGATPSISVSGPADVVPLVLTTVHDNVLDITLKERVILTKPVKVVITTPSLLAIDLSGSGSLNASGISGDSLNLSVSGSGTVVAAGNVNMVNVAIKGSGGVDVRAVHAKGLNASVQGSGDLRGYASTSAIINVAGSGDVRIRGNPPARIVNRSGSGDVSFE
ncbi:MAG: DUF2807 domain-containing protein [Paraburkholderia sp.]|uniref:GIN domain-containing protein n=1 Tax=Paraburkholderia sp. TaxID=1926495 RepID=UPI00397B9528